MIKPNKKYIFIFLIALVVVIYIVVASGRASVKKQALIPNSSESKQISFEIKPGEGTKTIASNLLKQGLVKSADIFSSYASVTGTDKKIRAGVYSLNTNMSVKDILSLMVSGARSEVWVTVPEGWRIDQIGDRLEAQGIVKSKEFQDRAYVKNFASTPFLVGLSGNTSLEGYLFPDTYRVYSDTTADDIIQMMLDNFGTKVTKDMMDGANKKGFTLHQFITMTSIIEKESAHSEDIRKIASVYYNRLDQGMLFQSDATITYITRRPDASPTFDETKTESPYNTYLYKGLPPGPVGNPGIEAMQATLNPETTDYLFFVSKDNRAYFAKTYEEHLQNIAKYLN